MKATWQNRWIKEDLIKALQEGKIVIMPTDTIYGIVAHALNVSSVEKIYTIRKRAPEKPCIILLGDINELEKFSITLSEKQKKIIREFSIPTSFILDCPNDKFSYLHRGTNTLAFRVPVPKELRKLLFETGPLIAPSANPEGLPHSKNIQEAKKYFGASVDLYVDGGEITGQASRVLKLNQDGSTHILRN